jgi:hypothetical protein
MSRASVGSLSGSSVPGTDNGPDMGGAITIEQDLPTGTKLWLSAWWRETAGVPWVSISGEIAGKGCHNRKQRRE